MKRLPFARSDLLIMLALAALAIALRLIPGLRIIDDAYITYRYARNIVEGVGFVYNPGEHVLGTTTPLYTLLLALLAWITRSPAYPLISVIVNALADGVNTALLYTLGRRLMDHHLPGLLLGLLWAVAPRSVTFAIGGMETSVYTLFMLAAFSAWLQPPLSAFPSSASPESTPNLHCQPRSDPQMPNVKYQMPNGLWVAAFTALATLTRPDALIWAGPLALALVVQKWLSRRNRPLWERLPWLEGGVYLALLAPWLIYAALTFGNPLPHSIAAKSVAYILPPLQALTTLLQHYANPFFEYMTFGQTGARIGSMVYALLAALGGLFLFHADRRSLPLAIFPWLYFAVFAAANPLMFRWYMAVPMPFYFLCIVAGLWGLAQRILGIGRAKWVLAGAGALWLILSLRAWVLHPDHGPDRPAPDMAWFKLELLYEQVGRELAPLVDSHTVIAAGDIGALGWYSRARILDTLGLISPEATPYYPLDPSMLATAPYAVAPDLIMDKLPDYVVILETYGRNGLLRDPRFEQHYRLRQKIPTDIYESDGMLVFERRDRSP